MCTQKPNCLMGSVLFCLNLHFHEVFLLTKIRFHEHIFCLNFVEKKRENHGGRENFCLLRENFFSKYVPHTIPKILIRTFLHSRISHTKVFKAKFRRNEFSAKCKFVKTDFVKMF
jgi:hypothetical protein